MASIILDAMKSYRQNLHNVGSLNNWSKDVLNQGAIVKGGNIDNYCLVKLDFDAVTGERTCEALAGDAEAGALIASVEDYMKEYETIASFFNAEGERARVVYLESGMRFECSNFTTDEGNLGDHPIKNGQRVHYDAASRSFLISNNRDGVTNNAGYNGAANKFVVVDAKPVSIDGKQVIRFEVA